jgi:hypothetical protein
MMICLILNCRHYHHHHHYYSILQVALRALNYSCERREFDAYYIFDGSKYDNNDNDLPQKLKIDLLKIQENMILACEARSNNDNIHRVQRERKGGFLARNVLLLDGFDLTSKCVGNLVSYLLAIQPSRFKVIVTCTTMSSEVLKFFYCA